jgi:periplasmic copper chaperone A
MRIPILIITLLLAPALAFAHSAKSGDIAIGHIWSYPAQDSAEQTSANMAGMPKGNVVDVYGPILNGGAVSDALTSVTSPAAAGANIIYQMHGQQTVQVFPLPLDPNKPVAFGPKTRFIRLYGVSVPAKAGDHFPITLHFKNTPAVTIDVMVQAR